MDFLMTLRCLLCRREAGVRSPSLAPGALPVSLFPVLDGSLTVEEHMRNVKLGQLEVQIGRAQAQLHATHQQQQAAKQQLQQTQSSLQQVEAQRVKAIREVSSGCCSLLSGADSVLLVLMVACSWLVQGALPMHSCAQDSYCSRDSVMQTFILLMRFMFGELK